VGDLQGAEKWGDKCEGDGTRRKEKEERKKGKEKKTEKK
jgi:hypothetical protein